MDFKNVDKKYRPIPFWSWNEKLDEEDISDKNYYLEVSSPGMDRDLLNE